MMDPSNPSFKPKLNNAFISENPLHGSQFIGVEGSLFYFSYRVFKPFNHYDVIESMTWTNYSFDQFKRWRWYFNYRTALAQVRHPKSEILTSWGAYKPDTRSEIHKLARDLRNRAIARKRKITETEKKIREAEEEWNQLFPIDDSPTYQKAKAKLFRLRTELQEFEEKIKKLEDV